jgi:protein-tyrosine phosphatase
VIDLHSHILHGLDDGAGTLDESLEMARLMVEEGVEIVAATPHVRDDWATTSASMERALAELRAAVAAADIRIDVRGGGEIALDMLESLDDDERRRFGLGGNPGALLLEFPYSGWPLALPSLVVRLVEEGIVPVIAHPERNPRVQAQPSSLLEIVRAGALVQLTAASVDGRGGRKTAACCRQLLTLECAHLIASDAHAPSVRASGLGAARKAVGDETLAAWLTEDVPGAILERVPLPARPTSGARRGGLLRRG